MAENGRDDDARARERADALVGRVLDGRYQIDGVLAAGAMGTVYQARHLRLKKRVALKVLHPGVADHPELFLRFEREAAAGAQVTHPHVAPATDFGELEDGTRYLVMELVRGTTLRALIDQEAPLGSVRAARIARQIASALGEIHARGIVHRDLKPRNVMLAEGDFVKIVDFGLAKIDGARLSVPNDDVEDDARLTGKGVIFGTVAYLAPEAAFGMELIDHRADLYALGVMLYEMLVGKHPFDAAGDVEMFNKHRLAEPPSFAQRAPEVRVERALEDVVRKLLAKDFDERYQSAREVIEAIDAAMPEAKAEPPEPGSQPISSLGGTLAGPTSIAVPSVGPPPMMAVPELELGAPKVTSLAAPAVPKDLLTTLASATAEDGKAIRAAIAGHDAAQAGGATGARAASVRPPARAPTRDSEATSMRGWAVAALVAAAVVGVYLLATSGSGPDAAKAPATTAEPTSSVSARSAPPPSSPAEDLAPPEPSTSGPLASAAPPSSSAPAVSASAPSSAPAATASASVAPDRESRAALTAALKTKRWDDAADAAARVLGSEPEALADAAFAEQIRKLLVALERERHPRTEELFRLVAEKQGSLGPDQLYKLLEGGGKSAWADRARALLREPAVQQRATPALRVAFVLRDAPCPDKLAALDRAVTDGDERSVTALDIVVRGCVKNPRVVDEALTRLNDRLEKAR